MVKVVNTMVTKPRWQGAVISYTKRSSDGVQGFFTTRTDSILPFSPPHPYNISLAQHFDLLSLLPFYTIESGPYGRLRNHISILRPEILQLVPTHATHEPRNCAEHILRGSAITPWAD